MMSVDVLQQYMRWVQGSDISVTCIGQDGTNPSAFGLGFYVNTQTAASVAESPLLAITTGFTFLFAGNSWYITVPITRVQSLTIPPGWYNYNLNRTDVNTDKPLAAGAVQVFLNTQPAS